MSLPLFLDEDSQSRLLRRLLVSAGHDVTTVHDCGMGGKGDREVFQRAIQEGRVLLTRNSSDFLALHQATPHHPGIFAVYEDADRAKNLSYAKIVKAIANIEETGQPIQGQFMILNQWVY